MGGQIQSPPPPSKITIGTFKRSGVGEQEAREIGKSAFKGEVTSLKVYNEEKKDKIGVRGIDQDRLATDV
ncbi:hypothetical protein Tco_0370852, partial [Tanacetum coccineum]